MICAVIIERKLLCFDRVAKQFAPFFNVEGLQMVLSRKADIELIDML